MLIGKKLWQLLLEECFKNKASITAAGLCSYIAGELNRGDDITADVCQSLCGALGCDFLDITELAPGAQDEERD